MTVSSIATGYDGISLLAGNAAYDPAATFLIQRQTLTSTTATVTFSSIPSTYKHLQIRLLTRSSRAANNDDLNMRVNGISTASYSNHKLYGNGAAVTAAGASSATIMEQIGKMSGNTSTANIFGVSIIDIHDYASTTKNKTIRVFNGIDQNTTTGYVFLSSGLFQSTDAITSLTFSCQVSSFASGSTFALYGMVG